MTKDDIIKLAQEAGFADGVAEIVGLYGFMKFANLVAAAEREKCAKVCESMADKHGFEGAYATDCATAIRESGNT